MKVIENWKRFLNNREKISEVLKAQLSEVKLIEENVILSSWTSIVYTAGITELSDEVNEDGINTSNIFVGNANNYLLTSVSDFEKRYVLELIKDREDLKILAYHN